MHDRHVWSGERMASGVSPCFPSCLLLFITAHARLAGLKLLGPSPVSTAYFNIKALELQTCSILSTFWRIQTQVFKFVHRTLYPSEPFRMLGSCPEMNASLALWINGLNYFFLESRTQKNSISSCCHRDCDYNKIRNWHRKGAPQLWLCVETSNWEQLEN